MQDYLGFLPLPSSAAVPCPRRPREASAGPWAVLRSLAAFVLTAAHLPLGAATVELSYREQKLTVEGSPRTVTIPAGYVLEVLTDKPRAPRLITFAANGDLFMGSRSGAVYRLPPPYTTPGVLVSVPGYPHSVAFRGSEILIARTDGVYHAPYRLGQARLNARDLSLLARLPGGGGHSSRTVRVGPDGRVYASLGISGNCSDEYIGESYRFPDRRGGVMVLREEGGAARWEPYATGLRNPVGYGWHPGTGVMYASNNGPDHLGFEQPPEYFAKLDPGSFHGMPWFQYDGSRLFRDDCIDRAPPRPMQEVRPPVATFPARSAPMAVAFVPKGAMDTRLEGDAVVALRGSWGTLPHGGPRGDPATRRHPKIVAVRFERGEARRVDDLVTGFQLAGGRRWARPVGVAVGPDGALYFSSDQHANALFRLRRQD